MKKFNNLLENIFIFIIFFRNIPWFKLKDFRNIRKNFNIKQLLSKDFEQNELNNFFLITSIHSGKTKIIQYLINKGIKINNSVLLSAIYTKNIEALKIILPNNLNEDVYSSLLYMMKRNLPLLKFILEETKIKIDINNLLTENYYFLEEEHINFDIFKYLLEKGADINFKNGELLYRILKNNQKEIIQYLIEKGANLEKVFEKIINNYEHTSGVERLLNLLENKPDFNIHMKDDYFLNLAINYCNIEIIQFFEDHGSDILKDSQKILLEAIDKQNIKFVKFILEKKIDIHLDNEKALNQSIIAYDFGTPKKKIEIIQLLIEKGANFYQKENNFIQKIIKQEDSNLIDYMFEKLINLQEEKENIFKLMIENNLRSIHTLKLLINNGVSLLDNKEVSPYLKALPLLKILMILVNEKKEEFIKFIIYEKNIQLSDDVKKILENQKEEDLLNQLEKRELFYNLNNNLTEDSKIIKTHKKLKI